jgi:hypothetical protein
MSSPEPVATPEGLLGKVASGYGLAWSARRPLAAVLLPVVAAMLLGTALLDVVLGEGRLVIVDGVTLPGEAGILAWAKAAVAVSCWLIALIAGAWAISRGTGPVEALRHGTKHLPAFGIGLIAAGGCLFLALWAVAGLTTGRPALVLTVAVLVAAALTAARVLLAGIAWAVEGSGRKPAWAEAGSFLLGGVAVPLLIAYGRDGIGGFPYAGVLVDTVLVTVVLAAQVGLVARPYVRDPAARRSARLWPATAMVTAAVLVSVGVVVANPYAAPSVRTQDDGPSSPVAVAWPAGQHPVIATISGVWFCDDDLCEDFTDVHGGPPAMDGYGAATIGADGTVVRTAVTGGPEKGGPFVHYARCVREGCQEAWLPVRATAAEKLDPEAGVEVAGAVAPDGALWFFVAAPIAGGELGRYRFSLIRCTDVVCKSPQRHQLGTTARTPQDGHRNGDRARLSIGADGRPAASFWIGWSIRQYSCEPVTCAGPRESDRDAAPPNAIWDGAVAFRPGQLFDGRGAASIAGDAAAQSGALFVAGPQVYVAAALPSGPDSGFHLSVGEPTQYWRQTVWRCVRLDCVRSPMDVYEGEARRELLAVAEDGRVLVVRDDHIALLETP